MKLSKQLIVVLMTLVFALSMSHASEASSLEKQSTASLQKQINALKKENNTLKKSLATSKKEAANLKTKLTNVEKSNLSLTAKLNEYKKYEAGVKTKSGVVKSIRVTENQAEFYLDGQRLLPTVSEGKAPRTFTFDNQLYAPIGSVGQALLGGQKPMTWDAAKQAMYFGIAPQGKVVPISKLNVFQDLGMEVYGPDSDFDFEFEVLGNIYYPTNSLFGSYRDALQYKLDGNYQSLKGTLAMPQESVYENKKSKLLFFSLDSYGNDKQIGSYDIKSGDPFVNVNVDLSGVRFLQIQIDGDYSVLHNVTIESLLN